MTSIGRPRLAPFAPGRCVVVRLQPGEILRPVIMNLTKFNPASSDYYDEITGRWWWLPESRFLITPTRIQTESERKQRSREAMTLDDQKSAAGGA